MAWTRTIIEELGMLSIYNSPFDSKLLCMQRFARLFAYGGACLILALHLSELGIPDERIGLFMTLTLWGDVVISFCLTLVADGLGRRAILCAGALLMAMSGIAFALSGNFWILLAAAVFGVISPAGNEIGPFRAIEESTLAHLSAADVRSDIYAWYTLIGQMGTACGIICCGWVIEHLKKLDGWDVIRSYRAVFYAYAALGIVKFFLALALSKNIEAERQKVPPQDPEEEPLLVDEAARGAEHDELVRNEVINEAQSHDPRAKKRLTLPSISPASRVIVVNLCLLFALDSFASGLTPTSWVTLFFRRKFGLPEGELGSIFFTTSMISAASTLVASSIAKRIGNVKAMVFTHLPSAIASALIPIPSHLSGALFFLVLRSCTAMMDVGPRTAFLAAVVLPNERTAVMGILNVVKTFSQSIGPSITGVLAPRGLFWASFVMMGCLKAIYDLGMLAVFVNHVSHEDKAKAAAVAQAESEEQRGA